MKIIDILNTIARGEEPPKKIMYEGKEYRYEESVFDYLLANEDFSFNNFLFKDYVMNDELNKEVTILETTITMKQDKKIEKLELDEYGNFKRKDGRIHIISPTAKAIIEKIDEIIEVINER